MNRAQHRLAAPHTLWQRKAYPDVVRESRELIELCLKAVLRHANIEPPRTHDVSQTPLDNAHRLPSSIATAAPTLAKISRTLRRDRELAFRGLEN